MLREQLQTTILLSQAEAQRTTIANKRISRLKKIFFQPINTEHYFALIDFIAFTKSYVRLAYSDHVQFQNIA